MISEEEEELDKIEAAFYYHSWARHYIRPSVNTQAGAKIYICISCGARRVAGESPEVRGCRRPYKGN